MLGAASKYWLLVVLDVDDRGVSWLGEVQQLKGHAHRRVSALIGRHYLYVRRSASWLSPGGDAVALVWWHCLRLGAAAYSSVCMRP